MSDTVLKLVNVCQSFSQANRTVDVLKDVNLSIDKGEVVGLVGPSGSGKSSLLHIAGLLEKPKSGDVFISGRKSNEFSDKEKTKSRRDNIGFVYQYHHLLPEFTALENVAMPLIIAGQSKESSLERAEELLVTAGLQERLTHRPSELSGGEQQRVAIARALANKPDLVLADEPTGNLDPDTGDKLFALLSDTVKQEKTAILIVTHNLELAGRCDRQYRLHLGQILA